MKVESETVERVHSTIEEDGPLNINEIQEAVGLTPREAQMALGTLIGDDRIVCGRGFKYRAIGE